jgi:hypothetical protein
MALQVLAALLAGSQQKDEPEPRLTERDVRSKLYEDYSTGNVSVAARRASARGSRGHRPAGATPAAS